jgi:hypothetical protein
MQLDKLRCEALALPVLSDERPLRGALGLVDWRLCGFVSRLILRGELDAQPKKTLLVPGRPKLAVDKVFLFGAGSHEQLDQGRQRDLIAAMLDTVARAGVRTTALVLPGRGNAQVNAQDAMESFIAVALPRTEHDEIVLIEPAEAQRAMEPVLERERRRAHARAE